MIHVTQATGSVLQAEALRVGDLKLLWREWTQRSAAAATTAAAAATAHCSALFAAALRSHSAARCFRVLNVGACDRRPGGD